MKQSPCSIVAEVFGTIILSTATALAAAQTFEPVGGTRFVEQSGTTTVFGRSGEPGIDSDFHSNEFFDVGPVDIVDVLSLSAAAPDATAAVQAEVITSQMSSVGSQQLRFNGRASFDATVSGSPGPGSGFDANAISFFGMFVNVDTGANVVLVYDATINGFSLANSIDVEVRRESDAEILFADTLRTDPQTGAAHHSFTMPLFLSPGQYGVSIDVRAINFTPTDFASNAAVAALSISAIPEAPTWLLLGVGLGLVPLTIRSQSNPRCSQARS